MRMEIKHVIVIEKDYAYYRTINSRVNVFKYLRVTIQTVIQTFFKIILGLDLIQM